MKIYTAQGRRRHHRAALRGAGPQGLARPTAYGTVDEAQAALGVARAECVRGGELDEVLVALERDLWVLMAEMATAPGNRHKLTGGTNLVTADMVVALEAQIDAFTDRYEQPTEFVVPGQDPVAAQLDVARTVVRRAERDALAVDDEDHGDEPSQVTPYLNRLSDLVWTLARWQEANAGGGSLPSRGA